MQIKESNQNILKGAFFVVVITSMLGVNFLNTNVLRFVIFILLLAGAVSDIRYRKVSNKITLSIILLSLPLIYYNSSNIQNSTYIMGITFMALNFIGSIGGADLKAILPLIFSVSNLFLFIIVFSFVGVAYAIIKWKRTGIPYFIPITISYAAVVFIA